MREARPFRHGWLVWVCQCTTWEGTSVTCRTAEDAHASGVVCQVAAFAWKKANTWACRMQERDLLGLALHEVGGLSCEKRLNAGLVGPYRRGLGRGPSVCWAWLEPALGHTVGFK